MLSSKGNKVVGFSLKGIRTCVLWSVLCTLGPPEGAPRGVIRIAGDVCGSFVVGVTFFASCFFLFLGDGYDSE